MQEPARTFPFPQEARWRERSFAVGRAIAFSVLFVAASYGVNVAFAGVQKLLTRLEDHILLAMATNGTAALLLIAALAPFGGKGFFDYGFRGSRKLSDLIAGIVAGLAVLAIQLGIATLLGGYSWTAGTAPASQMLEFGLLFTAMFMIVSLTEESIFRGYLLGELSRGLSFWPAALLLAVLFGLPHWLKGGGETLMGGIQAALFGLVMAWSVRRTGAIWFALGAHTGWNYGESFVFGVPNSALSFKVHLLQPANQGAHWLTGGTAGPEGSTLTPIALALLAAGVYALTRARRGT